MLGKGPEVTVKTPQNQQLKFGTAELIGMNKDQQVMMFCRIVQALLNHYAEKR